jgi:hypothetical protein
MPRRNRVVSFLIMPIAVFFWGIGWSLYWIGSTKKITKHKPQLSVQKELSIFVPTPQQKHATEPKQKCRELNAD